MAVLLGVRGVKCHLGGECHCVLVNCVKTLSYIVAHSPDTLYKSL